MEIGECGLGRPDFGGRWPRGEALGKKEGGEVRFGDADYDRIKSFLIGKGFRVAVDTVMPSPATRAILRLLKAGESVFQTRLLTKTMLNDVKCI